MLVEYYNCFIKKLKTIVNIVYERTQMIINTSFQLDLNLKQEEGDVTSFITNGEWDLIRTYTNYSFKTVLRRRNY